ncbi:MAG: helix-turn-helix domain-containing protein [Alphaproteobacteria bacterium]|nr:helix-turn-helix domain-containing protein [Alphaproteobacteria bacterium]
MAGRSLEGSRRLNRPQAAEFLGISRSCLAKMALTGDGPSYFKVGARVIYDAGDLACWLECRRRASTSQVREAA